MGQKTAVVFQNYLGWMETPTVTNWVIGQITRGEENELTGTAFLFSIST